MDEDVLWSAVDFLARLEEVLTDLEKNHTRSTCLSPKIIGPLLEGLKYHYDSFLGIGAEAEKLAAYKDKQFLLSGERLALQHVIAGAQARLLEIRGY